MKRVVFIMLSYIGFALGIIRVRVSIYNDPVGTYSINFITKQFSHTYEIYQDRMQVTLIPLGLPKLINTPDLFEVLCKYDADKCFVNKVHSCVIKMYSVNVSTEFVVCSMKSWDMDVVDNLQTCATDNEIIWTDIEKCLNSGRAEELLILNNINTYTVAPTIDYIPRVVFNDVYDKVLQKLSLENFHDIIEFLVNGIVCETCNPKNSERRVRCLGVMTVILEVTILYMMK